MPLRYSQLSIRYANHSSLINSRLMTSRQKGFTLLEVLIALSIFALIGVASFRVLSSVIEAQKRGDVHSQQLAHFQKALTIIDADLQQLASRNIRSAIDQEEAWLDIKRSDFKDSHYAVQLTRAGRANPLKLSRSALQRVAFDIGLHPQVNNSSSEFYGSQRNYLRRHYWPSLDRHSEVGPITQVLLADIDELTVAVLSDQGRHLQWPPKKKNNNSNDNDIQPLAIEFAFIHPMLGKLTRIYKVY